MTARLHRLVVSVTSLDRSLAFYGDILGLSATVGGAPGDRIARISADGGVELLLHERATTASDRAVAATFALDDLDDACARWAGQGGVIVDPPADQPWGERMAVVRDADGHLVCLTQEAPGA
jgi:predicted enzyme related to lactoylglutathione lyase